MNKKKIRAKGILLSLLAVTVLALSGCGKKEVVIPVADVQKAIEDKMTALPEMSQVTSEGEDPDVMFAYICDLDYSKVESYTFIYSSEGTPEEVAVIKLKNAEDAAELKTLLEKSNDQRKTQFETYNPEEVGKVENAQIESKGKYVVLIVGDQAGAGKQAFFDCFE